MPLPAAQSAEVSTEVTDVLTRFRTDDAAIANLGEMLALAKYPNVTVKLSGAPSYTPFPPENARNPFKVLCGCADLFLERHRRRRSSWEAVL